MISLLPISADEIHIKWRINEGGIGITAFTDNRGLPYLGLYPLNGNGDATGLPVRFQRHRLMADVVTGFIKREPIVIFVDVEATPRGLELTICPPSFIARRGYERHKFTAWGSGTPRYSMSIIPANSNWPIPPKEIVDEQSAQARMEKEPPHF